MTHVLAAFGPGLLVHLIPVLLGIHLIQASRQLDPLNPDGAARRRKRNTGVMCLVVAAGLFCLDLLR